MADRIDPMEFVRGCRIGRPTKHLHGWHAHDLADMVADLIVERDALRALLDLQAAFRAWHDGRDGAEERIKAVEAESREALERFARLHAARWGRRG